MPADIKFRGAKQDRSEHLSDRQISDHKISGRSALATGEKNSTFVPSTISSGKTATSRSLCSNANI
jgi:hypothetical protein